MSYKRTILQAAALSLVVAVAGCGSRKLPADLPKLYPQTVAIMQEGKPLADASVYVEPAGGGKWNAGGSTDANGIAELYTNGLYRGVASGSYKMTVSKMRTETTSAPRRGMPEAAPDAKSTDRTVSYVELKYVDMETTPLELVVPEKKESHRFDLGPAKEIPLASAPPRPLD